MIRDLKKFNWQVFTALCASSLIPAVYQTVKTFIIAVNNESSAFDIVGQMEWFDLIDETLQAFLIIPLYSILNSFFKKDRKEFSANAFKLAFTVFIVYAIFSSGVLIHGISLIKAMKQTESELAVTNTYLQLETAAFMAGVLVSFIKVVFLVTGTAKNFYIFLGISTFLRIISDFIFIPAFKVYGIAFSNILVNCLLTFSGFILLYRQKCIRFAWFHKSDLPVLKTWIKTGTFSGLQQFIDNIIYAVMICKMVNMVQEQGNYWIANNFIWGWLLIPVSALSEVIRRDCKDGYKSLLQSNYYLIGLAVVLLWTITIPLWMPFFKYAVHLQNAGEIFLIVLKLFPFYIAYTGCAIIDNIFIGLGKTHYNAVNSLIMNFIYYGIFFVLYLCGKITFSMNTIILMFGFGMGTHYIVSFIEEKVFLRRNSE